MSEMLTLAEAEKRGRWRYRSIQDHPNFMGIDPEKVDFMRKRIAEKMPSGILDEETRAQFASPGQYRPTTRAMFPAGLGYVQAPYIGSLVLPEWESTPVGGRPKNQASYPVTGTERYEINDKPLAPGAEPDSVDIVVSFATITLEEYGGTVMVTDLERDEAAGNLANLDLDTYKLGVVQTQTETLKEKHQATAVKTTGNYASGTYYTTLSGSTQWSHASGTMIDDVAGRKRTVAKGCFEEADLLWLSPDAFTAARKNAQVLAAVQYGGDKIAPGTMVPPATLVALFNMNIAIGGARNATTPGGTPSEIWGQDAGIVCTGNGQLLGVRFGVTGGSQAYPYQATERKALVAGRGGDKSIYTDAWKTKIVKSTAGFLWVNASAAY